MNALKKRIAQSFYAGTGIAGKKKEDIFLVSFPKSGNTWVKFLLLNILINNKEINSSISFKLLDETIPELGRDNLLKPWKFKTFPRFIKSHLPYKNLFFGSNRSLLIIRDPKDVMVSYYHYVMNTYGYNFKGDFSEFIRSKKFGLEACILHQLSWQNKTSVCIKFEELKIDKGVNLLNALQKLGVQINSELFYKSFEDAGFSKMKDMEKGPKKYNVHKSDYSFARKGTSNQWLEYFTGDDIVYYKSLLKKYSDSYTTL